MAKVSPGAKEFYEPRFGAVSWILVLCTTLPLDFFKFVLDFIPIVDLSNLLISIAALCTIDLFFFIKLGFGYLGGKKAGQKQMVLMLTTLLGLIPLLDGIDFDETIDAVATMLLIGQEDKLIAEEKAAQAAQDAQAQEIQERDYALHMQAEFELEQEES